jgi:uncharacterized glyoxalase superfamily protein PhnB
MGEILFMQPTPILRIFDVAKAKEFYIDYLDFEVRWEHRFDDESPLYMEVGRNGCTIHLSEHFGDATPVSALRIQVSDIGSLHKELQAKQYRYYNPGLGPTPWGTVELCLQDPFGNRLIFFEPQ